MGISAGAYLAPAELCRIGRIHNVMDIRRSCLAPEYLAFALEDLAFAPNIYPDFKGYPPKSFLAITCTSRLRLNFWRRGFAQNFGAHLSYFHAPGQIFGPRVGIWDPQIRFWDFRVDILARGRFWGPKKDSFARKGFSGEDTGESPTPK